MRKDGELGGPERGGCQWSEESMSEEDVNGVRVMEGMNWRWVMDDEKIIFWNEDGM